MLIYKGFHTDPFWGTGMEDGAKERRKDVVWWRNTEQQGMLERAEVGGAEEQNNGGVSTWNIVRFMCVRVCMGND